MCGRSAGAVRAASAEDRDVPAAARAFIEIGSPRLLRPAARVSNKRHEFVAAAVRALGGFVFARCTRGDDRGCLLCGRDRLQRGAPSSGERQEPRQIRCHRTSSILACSPQPFRGRVRSRNSADQYLHGAPAGPANAQPARGPRLAARHPDYQPVTGAEESYPVHCATVFAIFKGHPRMPAPGELVTLSRMHAQFCTGPRQGCGQLPRSCPNKSLTAPISWSYRDARSHARSTSRTWSVA